MRVVVVGFVLSKNRVLEPFKGRNEEADISEFGFHWDNDTGAFADKPLIDAVIGIIHHIIIIIIIIKKKKIMIDGVIALLRSLRLEEFHPDFNPGMEQKTKDYLLSLSQESQFWDDSVTFSCMV